MKELPKELLNEIEQYCKINNHSDIDSFILKMVRQGFTIEKFGATPNKVSTFNTPNVDHSNKDDLYNEG